MRYQRYPRDETCTYCKYHWRNYYGLFVSDARAEK